METVKVTKAERQVLDAMRASPTLRVAFKAMVETAQSGELMAKPTANVKAASAALPEPKKASTLSIEEMKAVLRAADCLYDDRKIWKQLGAPKVPQIPDTVIQEAYEKGGRVILRCSSISDKTQALKKANHSVIFMGDTKPSHYQERVSQPEWIVVPSHIDNSTLGLKKSKVVTSEMPAPSPEDWFSAIAYAVLDGERQPKGCEELAAFTTESGTVVGSYGCCIRVLRFGFNGRRGARVFGAARFGPPRN